MPAQILHIEIACSVGLATPIEGTYMFDVRHGLGAILLTGSAFASTSAQAQETKTYTYDALGRVTGVATSGGPVSGTNATYTYDKAGNRQNVTVSGSPNGSASSGGNGDGASLVTTRYIVVPLNGFTIIPINQ